MDVQVISADSKTINLSVKETDIGVLYIIQHELLKDANTDFAGVIVKHPLTNECWMKVNARARPVQQIRKATEAAMKITDEFKQLLNNTIKGN